jgi:hypothetical protein
MANEGRGEHQGGAATLEHGRNLVFRTEKCAAQIGVERVVPVRGADAGDLAQRTQRAGIVEGDIESAKVLDGQFDRLFRDIFPFYVTRQRERLAARGDDLVGQRCQFPTAARHGDDVGAFLREQLRRLVADAGAGAGHDGCLACQNAHMSVLDQDNALTRRRERQR